MYVLLSRTLSDGFQQFHIDTIDDQPDAVKSIQTIIDDNDICVTNSFDQLLDPDDLDVQAKMLILKCGMDSFVSLRK